MTKKQLKQARYEMRRLTELKNWDNNPRSILKEEFTRLQEVIKKLGIHNGLLINQDNIVLGGNMRLRAYHLLNQTYDLTEVMCRVVDTKDEAEMLAYALNDNDNMGVYDEIKLAEMATLHPIETRLYKIHSPVLRPLEHIINPPDPAVEGGDADPDASNMDESLSRYLGGNIKQIVLYYANEEYAQIIEQLSAIAADMGLDNHTDAITKLIKDYHAGITADKKAS